jgi:short-subunit dehydrogenase involved in D-alanine esterification of teichoic acids
MNASIATEDYETFEDNESTITVNVVSTTYLILLLLPILRKSATKYQTTPIISVVSSGVHAYTTFPERKTPSPFATLNDPKLAVMTDR